MTSLPVVHTIGFTKTSAEKFFNRLSEAKVKLVIDVRLHNTSQLAGFAKADDLAFFLDRIGNIGYRHMPLLAPEDDMLKSYKKGNGSWPAYEGQFMALMSRRKIEDKIDPSLLDGACLLCSEDTPHNCHRRLVCEYLNSKWNNKLLVQHI
jgi:uncharacterized protein (DUF488 family)